MVIKIEDIELSKAYYKDMFNLGYQEFNGVGRFVNFKSKGKKIPFEVQFWSPQTPWALRNMINREKEYQIKTKSWMNEKGISRDNDLPAEVFYHQSGKLSDLKWYKDGFLHRKNGKPAIIRFSNDGLITDCFWLVDGHDISDKVIEYVEEKGWDKLRLAEEEIESIRNNFFSSSNYF